MGADKLMILAPFSVCSLRRIHHPKGDIMHALKATEPEFAKFGEAYFTTIHNGDTKGWKQHRKMTMNLIVPSGEVCFYLHEETQSKTSTVQLGGENYARLTVPPGYWMAFRGVAATTSMILNIASVEHDPSEAVDVPLSSFPLEAGT